MGEKSKGKGNRRRHQPPQRPVQDQYGQTSEGTRNREQSDERVREEQNRKSASLDKSRHFSAVADVTKS